MYVITHLWHNRKGLFDEIVVQPGNDKRLRLI